MVLHKWNVKGQDFPLFMHLYYSVAYSIYNIQSLEHYIWSGLLKILYRVMCPNFGHPEPNFIINKFRI